MPTLTDLPTELLMEIIKYYSELLPSLDARIRGVISDQFDGNDALRALSQTCRTLRNIFLPVLWKRVHASHNVRTRPKYKIRTRPKMLERRMIGIQKTRYVVPYIRCLSVTFVECTMYNWQPVAHFVRVLDLLPNLRDLTIIEVPNEMVSVIQSSFQGKTYPSVLSLALPANSASLLRYFPNIETLSRGSNPSFSTAEVEFFSEPKQVYEHVHTINNLPVTPEVVRLIRESMPHVQCLAVWEPQTADTFSLLAGMDALNDLRIRIRPPPEFYRQGPWVNSLLAAGQRVLRTSKALGRKTLRIQHMAYEWRVRDETIQSETVVVIVGGQQNTSIS